MDTGSLACSDRLNIRVLELRCMASWKDSILIHAPPNEVFAYVDNPSDLPAWLPNMVEVRNVIGTGLGQQYEYTYKMAGQVRWIVHIGKHLVRRRVDQDAVFPGGHAAELQYPDVESIRAGE